MTDVVRYECFMPTANKPPPVARIPIWLIGATGGATKSNRDFHLIAQKLPTYQPTNQPTNKHMKEGKQRTNKQTMSSVFLTLIR
jgi:hypothetical protein